jgi:phthiocerol/phenolphthiocerol synthesis type-I polyketide synthase C
MGGKTILSSDALDVLEELLISDRSDLAVLELDWSALSRLLPSAAEPKYEDLAALGQRAQSDKANTDDIRYLLEELSPEELTAAVKDLLKAELGEILRMTPDKIDPDRSVYDIGLDSLMGVELVLAIESRFGIQLSVMALSENPTVSKLTEKLISQLKDTPQDSDEAAPETLIAAQVEQAVSQHAADVDTQAIALFASDIRTGVAIQPERIIRQ